MLLGTYEDRPIRFANWQIADLRDYSRIRVREKAPQIGFSWLRACEALHEALLYNDVLTGFISVDQREAQEKILYALKLYDGLPDVIKQFVPLVAQNREELQLGEENRPSRVASYPATSGMRGRRMSVVLDEVDFYRDGGKDMYRAAVTRVMRGSMLRITLGSTCWGQDTELDRLMRMVNDDGSPDPDVVQSIARYPWPVVEDTEQLEGIELARKTLDDADFVEEYECVRGANALDPFPAELIRRQTHEYGGFPLDEFGVLMVESDAPLVLGADIGQTRNPSIFSLFEQSSWGTWIQKACYMPMRGAGRDARGLTLPEQHEYLDEMLTRLPNLKVVVDGRGIGAHMSQALALKYRTRVVVMMAGTRPTDQEAMDKDGMIVETKRMLEGDDIQLLPDKEQAMQFHRTRRNPVTNRYEQKGDRKETHFDRFWATAYAGYGIREHGRGRSAYSRHGLAIVGEL